MSTRPLHTIARTNSSVHITTPRNSEVLGLIGGGLVHEGLALTNDEVRYLREVYGYKLEDPDQEAADFFQAGADRNLIRHAQLDGLRLVAWLAKYLQEGDDPLAYIVGVMADSGMEVDIEDVEWAHGTADDPP